MAEKIVSAGVFTKENDLSFVAQGVGAIGATVIGPTQKGPALVPVQSQTATEFYAKLGYSSLKDYTAKTVEGYFNGGAGVVTTVRVLGNESYSTVYTALQAGGSGSWVAILAPTAGTDSAIQGVVTGSESSASAFVLAVDGTDYSCSLSSTSPNYITKVFGTSPEGSKALYVVQHFGVYASSSYLANSPITQTTASVTQSAGFDHAITPWIQSQTISETKYNLFKFHTIGDGNFSNKEVKVGIANIKAGTAASDNYGSFDVVIRAVNGTNNSIDLDRRPEVLETFTNVNLNPDSSNYILKVIGDKYRYNTSVDSENRVITSGSYVNNSAYIRIEMAGDITTLPAEVVPYGFAAPVISVPTALSSSYRVVPYAVTQSIDGVYNAKRYFGFDYESADSLNLLTSVVDGASANTYPSFSLDDITVPSDLSGNPYVGSLANVTGSADNRKFIVPFQYGYDGMAPTTTKNVGVDIVNTNVFGFDCSTATTDGTLQYKKAIDSIANAEEVDTNLVATPGLVHGIHTFVTTHVKDICESRGDCFYVMDISQLNDSVTTVVNRVETNELDSNYVAAYYPWVEVIESNSAQPIFVPPSVVMPGVFAFNDQVSYEWFAPAGLNRGGISEARNVKTALSRKQIDTLYDARINPIATFPDQGIVVWGQKTLQIKASALDRINVRRLLINLKKFIASTSRYLVFEQNTTATRNRFLNTVNPYMSNVQQKSGLYAFKVVMDDSNNTPDLIDRNILYGQIYLQPTKTAEFILLDFNVLPTGAEFPE